ncbi:hypothetical protein A7982_12531 [Minicystis rosea]|nr:hypothetical protein A7982_12531 [Minicystis rosea]
MRAGAPAPVLRTNRGHPIRTRTRASVSCAHPAGSSEPP